MNESGAGMNQAVRKINCIPAWVHGLWLGWADWIHQDGHWGDLDLLSSETPLIRSPSGNVTAGPVLRAIIAMEAAHHSDAALIHSIYRSLTGRQQTVVAYRYVFKRNWDEIPEVSHSTAHREALAASLKLRLWVLGLKTLKGDDEACHQAVMRGNENRLLYGC